MKTTNNMLFIILSVVAVVGAAFGISYYISRKKETNPIPAIPPVIGGSGGGGGGGATPTNLPALSLNDAFLSGGIYVLYATVVDAINKNTTGGGFTNRNKTLYASSLTTGETLYTDAAATTKAGAGFYFADSLGKGITVDANGVMTLYVTNLPSFVLKDAYLSGTYQSYANAQEAINKNAVGSGVTNRNATYYADSITTGETLYNNASATVKAVAGFYFFPTNGKAIQVDANGLITVFATTLASYTFRDAYGNGNTIYGSAQDALDRNQAGSGLTHRNLTIYAATITNGQVLYTNATGTVKAAQGFYFFPASGVAISVNANGAMTIYSGTATNLPAFTFKDAYGNGNTLYASAQDALDRNQAGSGLTHRNLNVYATSIADGQTLYTNALGLTKVPQGFYFYPTTGKAISVNVTGVMTIFGGTVTNLPQFSINDAYQNGAGYSTYASLTDALDKNLDNSGFTNRAANVYATVMNNGIKAYTSALGIATFPAGNYFYPVTWEMLNVAQDGTMTFTSDVSKTGVNPVNINESYQ